MFPCFLRFSLRFFSFDWGFLSMGKRTSRGQKGNLRALARICEFHQSYFRRRKSVSWDVRIISVANNSKAIRGVALGGAFHPRKRFCKQEGRFYRKRQSGLGDRFLDFVGFGRFVRWHLWSDLEQELKTAESDSVSEISSSSATRDESDESDYGVRTSATKNSNRKKRTAKNKQREGNDRNTLQSKRPTVNWPQ